MGEQDRLASFTFLERVLHLLAFGDVLHETDMVVIMSVCKVERGNNHINPDIGAIGLEVPFLHGIAGYLSFLQLREELHILDKIVRMRDARPTQLLQLFLAAAGNFFELGVDVEQFAYLPCCRALPMRDGDSHGGLPEDGIEERSLFFQSLFKRMLIRLAEESLKPVHELTRLQGSCQLTGKRKLFRPVYPKGKLCCDLFTQQGCKEVL
ncbi:hypothetical protein SDC9_92046 [bioreactor metagenome]|uniref:Uncharacterized protein n=1 Tax=bioreactor metagenome TaxID=1076179 RepID=A0A644ZWL2_9ZZZZ